MAGISNTPEKKSFQVKKLEGSVDRRIRVPADAKKTIVEKEEGGYLVTLSRGHSVRVRNEKELRRLGLHVPAPTVRPDGEVEIMKGTK